MAIDPTVWSVVRLTGIGDVVFKHKQVKSKRIKINLTYVPTTCHTPVTAGSAEVRSEGERMHKKKTD